MFSDCGPGHIRLISAGAATRRERTEYEKGDEQEAFDLAFRRHR